MAHELVDAMVKMREKETIEISKRMDEITVANRVARPVSKH